jgi:hypothetical protein
MYTLRRWFRVLGVCLLVLALPLQGLAAAARLHCGNAAPTGQHAAPPASDEAALHAGHAHHHAGAPGEHTAQPDAGAKCSACAACCAAAALPVVWPVLPVLAARSDAIAFVTRAWAAQVPGGLERPPRPLLA